MINVVLVSAMRRHLPLNKRLSQGRSDPGLIMQNFNLDNLSFHWNFACGILVRFF